MRGSIIIAFFSKKFCLSKKDGPKAAKTIDQHKCEKPASEIFIFYDVFKIGQVTSRSLSYFMKFAENRRDLLQKESQETEGKSNVIFLKSRRRKRL